MLQFVMFFAIFSFISGLKMIHSYSMPLFTLVATASLLPEICYVITRLVSLIALLSGYFLNGSVAIRWCYLLTDQERGYILRYGTDSCISANMIFMRYNIEVLSPHGIIGEKVANLPIHTVIWFVMSFTVSMQIR